MATTGTAISPAQLRRTGVAAGIARARRSRGGAFAGEAGSRGGAVAGMAGPRSAPGLRRAVRTATPVLTTATAARATTAARRTRPRDAMLTITQSAGRDQI